MKKYFWTIFLLLCFHGWAQAQFQQRFSLFERNLEIEADSTQFEYQLPDSFVIANSEIIQIDSTQLQRLSDYHIDYISGRLRFVEKLRHGTVVSIYYQFLPLSIKNQYYHRRLQHYQIGDSGAATVPAAGITAPKSPPVSSTLRQNGSIFRGISFGVNQGMKLESGLRMQISGKIGDKVEVVAALTDQNTPIQPEGNTQSLQEIDKVFVQIKSDYAQATLGDYYFELPGTEFSPYQRKLQGVMGNAEFGNTQLTLSGAVSKGKFNTNQFLGQEGNQGPYQLRGDRGQIDIIVLAGTEKVWIDGALMTRGESNDYVIEYSNGQISFTRQRLITADSRITVDFQYSDQKYQRSLYSADLKTTAIDQKLRLNLRLLRESDNKDNPLDFILSDQNREILARAGDNPDSAVVSGVNFIGSQKGQYVAVDSAGIRFYRHVGVGAGDYNVSFSYVGAGNGDYKLIGYNHYRFVGSGKGSYNPVVMLTPAQRHDLIDVNMTLTPVAGFSLSSEIALSRFDRNLYSTIDDDDNSGIAATGGFRFQPNPIRLFGQNFGKMMLNGRYRRVQHRFNYISRAEEVEKNRKWDLSEGFSPEEEIIELNAEHTPIEGVRLFADWGKNQKTDAFISKRWQAGSDLNLKKFPRINYQVESIRTADQNSGRSSWWNRQHATTDYQFWKITPTLNYMAEQKQESFSDTLQLGFRYQEISPKISLANWRQMTMTLGYSNRRQDKWGATGFQPESEAKTQSLGWQLNNWKNLSLALNFTHRERSYADSAQPTKITDLADFRMDYSALKRAFAANWRYQISNTQLAKQERIYIKVERGQGNYRYDETLNEYIPDSMTGDYILRIRATDDFVPVAELRASATIKIQPERWRRPENQLSKDNRWKKWLTSLSSETFM
ncbi:MAG: hypothetical protein SCK70_08535, partial [bacterium]|nr:hypothetical protein [bacterium]